MLHTPFFFIIAPSNIFSPKYTIPLGKHLGDIVVPMSCNIGQPQCAMCHTSLKKITKSKKILMKEKEESQCHTALTPQCHTSAIHLTPSPSFHADFIASSV